MTTSSLAELKAPKRDMAEMSDTRVDMFSMQGFALAQRVATAFASSTAVPAAFRSHVLKKTPSGEVWEENPSALGNCLIAIEMAQAVGMSVIAVMQNADMIEGKLRWSAKFVIAAVNASRRFTPLRFELRNLGPIKAKYKEKQGWNNQLKRYDMIDREVALENRECIAWALPYGFRIPDGVRTLEQARAAGLPVIESVPVSMKMSVEEGWYAKSGSKWQTMPDLMLQYRAGTFFGNIHAPDIVMGMGRTAEEERDVVDLYPQTDGSYSTNLEELKTQALSATSQAAPVQKQAEPETKPTNTVSQQAKTETQQLHADFFGEEEKAAIAAKERAEAEASEQGQGDEPTTRGTRTARPRTQSNIE